MVDEIVEWILTCKTVTFLEFETQLVVKVFALGGLFVALFLCMREEQWQAMHPQAEAG